MNKEQVFEKVYKEHSPEIFRFCKFRLGNNEEAQDIASEAFIALFENEEFDFIENKRAWLFKVSRNMIYNQQTKKSTKDTTHTENFEEEVEKSMSSFEDEVVNGLTIEYIEEKLKDMDEVTSDIIIMRIWDEMSFNEIASIVEMGVDSVKKRFYRGIEDLKLSVSREEKSLALKTVSIPIILAGILGVSVQPAYAMTASSSAAIASAVGSTLGVTLTNMTNLTGAAAGAAIGASSGSSVATASASGGLLATTTAKIIAGSSILLASAGIGIGAVAVNNNQPAPEPEPTPIVQEQDEDNEINTSFEKFTYEEYGISFNLPKQDSYEGIEFITGEDQFTTENKFFVIQENEFENGNSLTIFYTPERFVGFPCGLGCVDESLVLVTYSNGAVQNRISELERIYAEQPTGIANYGITAQEEITLFGTNVTKLGIVGIADFFPNKYLFQYGNKVIEIDTFLNDNQEAIEFFNSIEAIGEVEKATKVCNDSVLGIGFSIPENWSCETQGTGDEGGSNLTFAGDGLSFFVTNRANDGRCNGTQKPINVNQQIYSDISLCEGNGRIFGGIEVNVGTVSVRGVDELNLEAVIEILNSLRYLSGEPISYGTTYTISTEDFVDSLGAMLKYYNLSVPSGFNVVENSTYLDGITISTENSTLDIGIPYEAYPNIVADYVLIGEIDNVGELYRVSFNDTNSVFYTDKVYLDNNCPAIVAPRENDCAESSFRYLNDSNKLLVASCSSNNNNYSECDQIIQSIKFD